MDEIEFDLFGNKIEKDIILRDRFIEPPFSVLDTKSGMWQDRKRAWKNLGILSELGRNATTFNMKEWADKKSELGQLNGNKLPSDTSIFDPALCEVLYKWFCPDGGIILDPFAGGSVRGIVANKLEYKYVGIELRQEQVNSNIEQSKKILPQNNQPIWICGDSDKILDTIDEKYDFVFSCPPYFDLEIYSDMPDDLSNMDYNKFLSKYESIIKKSCSKLSNGGLACFVVGEVRGKDGGFIGLVPDTINAFKKSNMIFYNEAILLNSLASAALRAGGNMKSKKLVKCHQNILVFKKGIK